MFRKKMLYLTCFEKRLVFEKRCRERGKDPFSDFRRAGTNAQRSWA